MFRRIKDRVRHLRTAEWKLPRRGLKPSVETFETRALMASLVAIPNQSVPQALGSQIVLNSGGSNNQTYSVTSSNPNIQATIAQGQFWTVTVEHTSSGTSDPAFTGNMTFQLFEDLTPIATERIKNLIQQGFYTSPTSPPASSSTPVFPNKNFHRVVPGFVVQGGSQSGNGSGSLVQPGYPFVDEFNTQLVFNGINQLAMANAGDDTNDSQFFITDGQPRTLDFNHTIFGQLVSGSSVVTQMTQVARANETPVNPILITDTTLSSTNPNGVIHVNAASAVAGETATITVTATDPSDSTTTQRTFTISVAPNNGPNGQPLNERAFLNPVTNQVTSTDQSAVFQITATNPEPTDTLTFIVRGGISTDGSGTQSFTPVLNATATVDENGIVRVIPNQGFTGVINLVVGVRDQVDRTNTNTPDSVSNFDTQRNTLTVQSGASVNFAPIALNGTSQISFNSTQTVTLRGDTANPQSAQTLLFTLLSSPQNGSISNFNPQTGTFAYIPDTDFLGTDSITFQVTDVGDPTPNLTSNPATQTFIVGGAQTGSVRLIDNVLVVTPAPRSDRGTNSIVVSQVGTTVQVRINGFIDQLQPSIDDVDRIVVYGSKANDSITIDPNLDKIATLDGGHGGLNRLEAGSQSSRLHGWFGFNIMKGSPERDALIGREGHVRFIKSGGRDLLFAGNGRPGRLRRAIAYPTNSYPIRPLAPTGTFYNFIGNQLEVRPTPSPPKRNVRRG